MCPGPREKVNTFLLREKSLLFGKGLDVVEKKFHAQGPTWS